MDRVTGKGRIQIKLIYSRYRFEHTVVSYTFCPKNDEKEMKKEVNGGGGFTNDVFSAGFLVKRLLIVYTHWCTYFSCKTSYGGGKKNRKF